MVKELGDRAHQKKEAKECPRMMAKQNPEMTTMHQAMMVTNQPQLGKVTRGFLKMVTWKVETGR